MSWTSTECRMGIFAPRVIEMTHEYHITRNFGHPWTRAQGWDLLEATADTEDELTKFIKAAEKKYWQIWLRDNTGQIAVVMYKPSGAKKPWDDDNPSKQ